ncbi:MAG: hypothetical protein GEU71_00550 [Actinobacteria bacterium]|nr:hypothetical protein [Actinomycetota bacterium]
MPKVDPVTFEVLRNALVSAVDEMGLMLEKVAFSLVVSEGRDFSTSISDNDGDLIADGTQDLPGHVGTIPFTTKAIIEAIGLEGLKPGDVIIMNDPYLGGTHCQDVRTVMPVYWDDELVNFVQVSAHWLDVGGRVPGSFQIDAASAYEEALYITPIHLVREGALDNEVLNLILRNIRVPEITRGDVVGMIEACRTGEERLHALYLKYGRSLMFAQMRELKEHSRRLLEQHFRDLTEGTYSFTDYVDYDPGSSSREPIPIHLDLTIRDGRPLFDFSKSGPQTLGAVNISRSLLWSGILVATKAIFPDVPVNQGVFQAVDLVAPDGLVVTAQFPASTSAGFSNSYEKVTACILGCFLEILPERSMVGSGNIGNFVLGGTDPRTTPPTEFIMYDWTAGGYGARPGKKDNHSAISLFASGTQNQPIEPMERMYPVLFTEYGFLPDSGGPGRHRGGVGICRSFRLMEGADGSISVTGDREVIPAWGFKGGASANAGDGMVCIVDGSEVSIGMKKSGVPVKGGWTLRYWEGGGGGYEPPWKRPTDWVLEDVVNGLVTVEGARRDYFVVVNVLDEDLLDYRVDEESTRSVRATAEASA